MNIKKIELKNFKFHKNLTLNIDKENCLIYGENGVGKSSIFWALYSIFEVYFRNNEFDFSIFKNLHVTDELEVIVTIDNNVFKIPNNTYDISTPFGTNTKKTVYFLNQTILERITIERNFFKTIESLLYQYFDGMNMYTTQYLDINDNLDSSNHEIQSKKKKEVDDKYIEYLEDVKHKANIIIEEFKEDFSISFTFNPGILDVENFKFDTPIIEIMIDDTKDIKKFFNEAKLKLTAIAIFLALIEKESEVNDDNSLKLLVLDDFLTSLDMANRNYIIEYIFTKFGQYQKIILTHNLQFYNLILNWLNIHERLHQWDIKNIYTRINDDNATPYTEAIIYSAKDDYLVQAEQRLAEDDLGTCGNLIRKEFERLIHEIEKRKQIGSKEETDQIVRAIINQQPLILKQANIFGNVQSKVNDISNRLNNYQGNEIQIKGLVGEVKDLMSSDNLIVGSPILKEILQKLVFYRKILLNATSHDNPNTETYRKEYENAIILIKKLRDNLNN